MDTSIPQNVTQCAFNFDALNAQPHEQPAYKPTQLSFFFIPTKICTDCGTEKDLEDFHVDRVRKDGHKNRCKACTSIFDHARNQTPERKARGHAYKQKPESKKTQSLSGKHRYQATRAQRVDQQRAWEQANPLKRIEINNRRRARKRAATVDKVDYTRIIERDGCVCHICGQDIDPTIKKGRASLTFDHVKPLAGNRDRKGTHSEDNLRPAHKCCNSRKGTKLLSEMCKWDRRGPDVT